MDRKKPRRKPWLLCLIAPISSVANWVDGYGRIRRGF
jgi:hypothetical protein